ncbi:MAG: hypothetical protein KDC34_20290 [Saprospiraceae bacterium]|nr:hypothetical protein [Saprospiraceae bacterium]
MQANILFIFLTIFAGQLQAQSDRIFTASEIESDLKYLQAKLVEMHPNLYTHSKPEAIQHYFDETINDLPPSLTSTEAYRAIAGISSVLKDGHTLINPPADFWEQTDGFFPFKVFWDGKALFIERNFSGNPEIENGSQIVSINGITGTEVIDIMLSGMMRDGDNLNYPIWVINTFFTTYYGYFFGHSTQFKLELIKPFGESQKVQVAGSSFAEIRERRKDLYPGQDVFSRPIGRGIYLEFKEDTRTAILTIPDFHVSILKKEYGQRFSKVIRSIFNEIEVLNPDKLILDLRHNQGGSIRNGRLLLSYLMDKPFQLVEGYNKVAQKEGTETGRLKSVRGSQMGVFKPKPNAFPGELIVLINGGSFSNSGIVCNALETQHRAFFIGEETGGNRSILSSDTKTVKLPETEIQVEIPTLQYVLNRDFGSGGVVPDILMQASIRQLVEERDIVLEAAMNKK